MRDERVGLESVTIDEDEFGSGLQLIEGQVHGLKGSLKDVDAVYFGGIHVGDGPGDGLFPYDIPKQVAVFFPELFGVVQDRIIETDRQDHGGSENGSGQAASSCFITSRFRYIILEESVQHPFQFTAKRYTASG